MSIATFILGNSGTGKTHSLKSLDPAKTLLIQLIPKPLPFKPLWKIAIKADENGTIVKVDENGAIFRTTSSSHIVSAMKKTKKKIIVIDDLQHLLASEYMERSNELGYDKFTYIAKNYYNVIDTAINLPEDVRVYLLSHSESAEDGLIKVKTIGKMLDNKLTPEGMVTITLRTQVLGDDYLFSTKNNGNDTVKSPSGMFDAPMIPNDLLAVDKAICSYYELDSYKE